MLIKIDNERTIDTDTLTYEELRTIKQENEDTILSIQTQIGMAKANKASTGEFASPQWFVKANTALRYKSRLRQTLQEVLSEKKKEERAKGRTWVEHFVDLCRERMSEDEFSELVSKAERRRLAAIE